MFSGRCGGVAEYIGVAGVASRKRGERGTDGVVVLLFASVCAVNRFCWMQVQRCRQQGGRTEKGVVWWMLAFAHCKRAGRLLLIRQPCWAAAMSHGFGVL